MNKLVGVGIGSLLICLIVLPAFVQDVADDEIDLVFQVSTLQSLVDANYDGVATFAEVMEHGDFGLGTFDALNGELVVVDGEYYQVKADGIATLVAPEETTPFAAVTFFEPDAQFEINDTLACSDLYSRIADEFPSMDDSIYAIRIEGDFDTLQVRSENPSTKPYPPLSDALADQIIFDYDDAQAVFAGFWFPESTGELNVVGFHFHAVTDDMKGGHVLDCTASDVSVQIDYTDQIYVQLFAYNGADDSTEE